MNKPDYMLVQMYEEEVPLSAYIDDGMFVGMVVAMAAIILTLTLISYLTGCYQCRKRIAELKNVEKVSRCWNLRRLQKQIKDLELMKAEEFF